MSISTPLVDRNAIMMVFGSIIQNPYLYKAMGKGSLTLADFDSRFTKSIFTAINNLVDQGKAEALSIYDIDTYLQGIPNLHQIFVNGGGTTYLQDCLEIATPSNFDYYYERVKKFTALRALQKNGLSITAIYPVNELDPRKEQEMLERFDGMSVSDIFKSVESNIELIKSEFTVLNSNSQSAHSGLLDLVEEYKKAPEVGRPIQGHLINGIVRGARRGKFYINSAASGTGKALPNNTKIPTPDGWRAVGEIEVGDFLYDAFGKPTKVLGVFPQGKKEVWEVSFADGRTAKCSKDHLWSYNTTGQRRESIEERKFFTETTETIQRKLEEYRLKEIPGYLIRVPRPHAVEYSEKDLPLDPYVMGCLLGDASFRYQPNQKALYFSSETKELPQTIADILGCRVERNSLKNHSWVFKIDSDDPIRKNLWVEEILVDFPDLWNIKSEGKFIPEIYLYGSIQQRYDLLNGLLDTDGSTDGKARVSYWTISKRMANQVVELCHSLGFSTSFYVDTHKKTNPCYCINIIAPPDDRVKLFRMKRKQKAMQDWYNNGKRKEHKNYLAITKIEALGYYEEMTCFLVDNKEHLFLTEDFIPTHNSRLQIGDACLLAYPFRWEGGEDGGWEKTNGGEKTLVLTTELAADEVQSIILANLTNVNEEKILYGRYTIEEEDRIKAAIKMMEEYDNLYIESIPDPSVAQVRSIIQRHILTNGVVNIFYDYIFSSTNLLGEFRDLKIREDVALFLLSTALKDIAVEYNVFVFSSTQLSGDYDNWKGIRNQTLVRGSKAVVDKVDAAYITSKVAKEDLVMLENYLRQSGKPAPTHVRDVYKVRRGRYNNVRVWSILDLGTGRAQDLFMTDANYHPIEENFYDVRFESVEDFSQPAPREETSAAHKVEAAVDRVIKDKERGWESC